MVPPPAEVARAGPSRTSCPPGHSHIVYSKHPFAEGEVPTSSSWLTSPSTYQTMLNIGTAGFEYASDGKLTGWDAGSITTADLAAGIVN